MSGYPFYPYGRGGAGDDAAAMSGYPFYPYGRGGVGDDAAARYSSYEIDLIAARYAGDPSPYPYPYPSASGEFDTHVGARRPADVLYHRPIMGSHSTIGQSDDFYSPNTMAKRPRLESSLPIYPQRPGEKECAFYMRTRTCKYEETCKFDHPQWVPKGGIPKWKEGQKAEESYPERPGKPDCPFFVKTGMCKFGSECKFNHPKKKDDGTVAGSGDKESLLSGNSTLPVKPSEPCPHYAKGKCKLGTNCKFSHAKDMEAPSSGENESENTATAEAAGHNGAVHDLVSAKKVAAVALEQNSKGMPIRPGEVDCSFYIKTGSCRYGRACRFNHPERHNEASVVPGKILNPAAKFLPSFDFRAAHVPIEPEPITYPQRPGETVCDFYKKTGFCKFSERCKFHHPVDRSAPGSIAKRESSQQPVMLTVAGFPRREDAEACAYYMKTGACKFGVQCKFDHPPLGEVIANVSKQGDGKKVVGLSYVLEN
ncbi:zinc finger CCCH domain-containing protein 8-like isoform X2 [Hordeum vulgare subsp. vulgare]|uniref:zinc finger CCCH domain-containing protein 8-like isoform X2 n=1 Tax=Hordeum vulgare subsp. vulgare TaxID=112509 RepID=UPI001D1A47F7|nr:zinc finger CCCH domain-containing protein 8-like isoform X2 [Hordeum vulgare subsp. vulgare]